MREMVSLSLWVTVLLAESSGDLLDGAWLRPGVCLTKSNGHWQGNLLPWKGDDIASLQMCLPLADSGQ